MSERSKRIAEAISFLNAETILSVLLGTLEALEEASPGYVDRLILRLLSIEAGIDSPPASGDGDEERH